MNGESTRGITLRNVALYDSPSKRCNRKKKAMQQFSHELITWSTISRRPEHVIHAVGVQHERRVGNVKFPGSLLAYANQTIMSSPRIYTHTHTWG